MHALTTQVFVRRDDGMAAPATIQSLPLGIAGIPALGRFFEVREGGASYVVAESRLSDRATPWTRPAFIAGDLSLERVNASEGDVVCQHCAGPTRQSAYGDVICASRGCFSEGS
jgi:hypothetical protein